MTSFGCLVLPLMIIYIHYGGYFNEQKGVYSSIATISLGNFGEATNLVARDYINFNQKDASDLTSFNCLVGKI